MILARSMTDKAAVKGPIMQISALLRPKTLFTTPYQEYVTIRVQMKIFALFRHVPSYNRVSVTTNINNSGLLVRIQDGDEKNSAARRKLRAILRKILRLSWTALKKKLMQKDKDL